MESVRSSKLAIDESSVGQREICLEISTKTANNRSPCFWFVRTGFNPWRYRQKLIETMYPKSAVYLKHWVVELLLLIQAVNSAGSAKCAHPYSILRCFAPTAHQQNPEPQWPLFTSWRTHIERQKAQWAWLKKQMTASEGFTGLFTRLADQNICPLYCCKTGIAYSCAINSRFYGINPFGPCLHFRRRERKDEVCHPCLHVVNGESQMSKGLRYGGRFYLFCTEFGDDKTKVWPSST